MTRTSVMMAAALAIAAPALAQESPVDEYMRLSWIVPDEILPPLPVPDPAAAAPVDEKERERTGFLLGARAGYLKARGADRGTWLGGVQGRLYLVENLAAEGSIEFHQDDFLDGDAVITFYPVQVSAILSPFPHWPVRPYAVGGAGWYYTRINYRGALEALDSQTEHFFGVHVGAGAEIDLGDSIVLNADSRYVFVDEPGVDNSQLEDEEWDYWELTIGVNFRM